MQMGFSSPAESGILDELGLSLTEVSSDIPLFVVINCHLHCLLLVRDWSYNRHFLFFFQYSLFGSISTVGSLLGAVLCGKLTDVIGRRGVSWQSDKSFCYLSSLSKYRICFSLIYSTDNFKTGTLGFGCFLHCRMACNSIFKGYCSLPCNVFLLYSPFVYFQCSTFLWRVFGRLMSEGCL